MTFQDIIMNFKLAVTYCWFKSWDISSSDLPLVSGTIKYIKNTARTQMAAYMKNVPDSVRASVIYEIVKYNE